VSIESTQLGRLAIQITTEGSRKKDDQQSRGVSPRNLHLLRNMKVFKVSHYIKFPSLSVFLAPSVSCSSTPHKFKLTNINFTPRKCPTIMVHKGFRTGCIYMSHTLHTDGGRWSVLRVPAEGTVGCSHSQTALQCDQQHRTPSAAAIDHCRDTLIIQTDKRHI
jgi:hypothetical protein